MKFKPRLRDQVRQNVAALTLFGEPELHPELQASLDRMSVRTRRQQTAVNIDAAHKNSPPKSAKKIERYLEKDVLRAVKQLLAVHPRVLFALRVNAGSASYEAKSGKWAPILFHEWLKPGHGFRMSDFMGATTDCRVLAIEAKRPGFTKPRDEREREQEAFLQCVRANGGRAGFATCVEDAQKIIED